MTRLMQGWEAPDDEYAKVPDPGMGWIWHHTKERLNWRAPLFIGCTDNEIFQVVEALRYVGEYFEAHPQQWIQGTFVASGYGRMCSIGLINPEYASRRLDAGIVITPPPYRSIPTVKALFQDFLIEQNDAEGMTPKRLRKVNDAVADFILRFRSLPEADRTTDRYEADLAKYFDRRIAKANFKKNQAKRLVGAGK
jgi:hypothetical protein